LIAHILYYFSDQNDLVFDPMAGGGVVADTCLAFNRKCWSFDMDDRPDTRPEIEPYFWDITNLKWPIKGKTKPDLIIFDPPASPEGEADPPASPAREQWRAGGGQVRLILISLRLIKKQSNNYDPDGISGMSKASYLEFLESFFALAHLNAKKSTQMAFINADWPARHRSRPKEAVSAPSSLSLRRGGRAGF